MYAKGPPGSRSLMMSPGLKTSVPQSLASRLKRAVPRNASNEACASVIRFILGRVVPFPAPTLVHFRGGPAYDFAAEPFA
jgi:hypothetical protein